jgi:large subunit ribosomal protein L29
MTRISDIRANSADQLVEQLGNLKKEQFNSRFQRAAGETGSLGRVKQVRRDIARIKTVQGEHQRGVVITSKAPATPKAKAPVEKKVAAPKAVKAPAKTKAVKAKTEKEGTK